MTHLRSSWNIWRPNSKMWFLDVTGLSSQRCRYHIGNPQIKDFCKSFELQDLKRMILPAGFSELRFTKCTGDSVWGMFPVWRWVLASSFIARPEMSYCEGRWRCQHWVQWGTIHVSWRNVGVYIWSYNLDDRPPNPMMIRIWYKKPLDFHGFSGESHSEILKHTSLSVGRVWFHRSLEPSQHQLMNHP